MPAARARGRIVRLLALWAALAVGLYVLRGVLDDQFFRALFLPIAFVLVVIAGLLTVRAARVRGASEDKRRRKERRLRDRRRRGREQ